MFEAISCFVQPLIANTRAAQLQVTSIMSQKAYQSAGKPRVLAITPFFFGTIDGFHRDDSGGILFDILDAYQYFCFVQLFGITFVSVNSQMYLLLTSTKTSIHNLDLSVV